MFLHLDYCNGVLINIHFNQCATIHHIFTCIPFGQASFWWPWSLLWLSIYAQIECKVCLLVWKCFNGLAFGYLHNTLRMNKNESRRTLCSSLDSLFWRFFDRVRETENDHLHLLPLRHYEIPIQTTLEGNAWSLTVEIDEDFWNIIVSVQHSFHFVFSYGTISI